jgi:hypothetical protein
MVFHQAKEFRDFMEMLEGQGHDIQSLAPHVRRIDELLRPVMNDILMNEGRQWFGAFRCGV